MAGLYKLYELPRQDLQYKAAISSTTLLKFSATPKIIAICYVSKYPAHSIEKKSGTVLQFPDPLFAILLDFYEIKCFHWGRFCISAFWIVTSCSFLCLSTVRSYIWPSPSGSIQKMNINIYWIELLHFWDIPDSTLG
jgi:hypothetical protein